MISIMQTEERVKRTYDVPFDLYEWLEKKAAREGRAVVRQVEKIIKEARDRDLSEYEKGK